MTEKSRLETRKFHCVESEREANLSIEWIECGGKERIQSVSCDNPKLADLDNWDCRWTCWREIEGGEHGA